MTEIFLCVGQKKLTDLNRIEYNRIVNCNPFLSLSVNLTIST